MKIFRGKYLYNPENPVFQNQNVKTYNCMNTQTKNSQLLLLEHLVDPPEVPLEKDVLQPIESPTLAEKFSIYPLVNCCSQIGKLNENDAMYVIKTLVECKLQNPIYFVISPSGICCSQVQGLLPSKSPDLFHLALELLDLPQSLEEVEKSVVSKNGYSICKSIRDNYLEPSIFFFQGYGWKQAKKGRQNAKDPDFWIFKCRRKQQGPFNDEYSLAWSGKHGMCRVKYIDLSKDSYLQELEKDFISKIQFFEENQFKKQINSLEILKMSKDTKGITIFTSIANQGNLSDYIARKREAKIELTQTRMQGLLQTFIAMMVQISNSPIQGHGALHIKNIYVHDNRITIGQPMFITEKNEKKLRDLRKGFEYFAPELKDSIIQPQNVLKLDKEKMDVWSFGFLLHKIFTGEVPLFDSAKKPILEKSNISFGMKQLIKECLKINPANRPRWSQIDIRNLRILAVQQHQQIQEFKEEIYTIKNSNVFGTHTRQRKFRVSKQVAQSERTQLIQEKQAKLQIEQDQPAQQQKIMYILPPQMALKIKRMKLTFKIVIIMIMYIFVFFGKFFQNSLNILILKDSIGRTPLHLIDYNGNILSSVTILTAQSKFFLLNDISFADIQNIYHCINDSFDPINNPNYSLLDYIQTSGFNALLIMGWITAIVICCIKAISIWKGGISNRPKNPSNKYWVVYGFHELSLASLLFAHFFIFQFFYFSGISPCFYIEQFEGIQPFFDSSLYLFLSSQEGYVTNVFATLGVLAILLVISGCWYSWGPKLDLKYFISIPSILFRVIPYILLFLICRIGVFTLFSPTALNDSTQILPSLIRSSSRGFFGILPEIFILICVLIQVLLEFAMLWCEQKASENDSLSRMLNISDIKKQRTGNSNGDDVAVGMNENLQEEDSNNNLNRYI